MTTPTQKPNLMSTARSRQETGQRILASLEHGGKPPAPPPRTATRQLDGWIVGVGLLVTVLAVFAWNVRGSASTPEPSRAREEMTATPAAKSESSAQAIVAQRTSDGQPAAIINEPPTLVHRPLAGMPSTSAAATPAPSPAVPVTAPSLHVAAPSTRTVTSAAGPRTVAPAAARASAAPAAGAASGDTDVALLTALVAHAGQPATITPERSRDVVERHDDDGTASLLARCKQLGLIEGMLCRSRICAGRWDSDAACRAPNH